MTQRGGFRFLGRSNPNKKKKALEQLLQTGPSFPGIPLHVCTDVSREEMDEVEVKFPMHIRNVGIVKVFFIFFQMIFLCFLKN